MGNFKKKTLYDNTYNKTLKTLQKT